MAATRSSSTLPNSASMNSLLDTFDSFKQKHVKQNREIIHKNAELLRNITDLNRTVRDLQADQLADAIRSKIRIARLEHDLKVANERTAEWRKRSENGPGAFAGTVGGVDGVKTTLGSVIDQLMRLQNGIEEGTPSEGRGAGTESPPNSELGASTNTLAKRPSRTDLKAPRERRPSTLAAGGRPDLSLISEGSGLEEDEDEGDRQTGVLQGLGGPLPSPTPSPLQPVSHVDLSRRAPRRQSGIVTTTSSLSRSVGHSSNDHLPQSSSTSSISSTSSSSSSTSDRRRRRVPGAASDDSGTETEREVPKRRGSTISGVKSRPAPRRTASRLPPAAPPLSVSESEEDLAATAKEWETEDDLDRNGHPTTPGRADAQTSDDDNDDDSSDDDFVLASLTPNPARVDKDRVPTPVSPPIRRRSVKHAATPVPSAQVRKAAPLRGATPSAARSAGAGIRDITARRANTVDEPIASPPRSTKKQEATLETVAEETQNGTGPNGLSSSQEDGGGRESRRARKSVNYALPSLSSKMRQPEGYTSTIKKPEAKKGGKARSSTSALFSLASSSSPPKSSGSTAARRASSAAGLGSSSVPFGGGATLSSARKAVVNLHPKPSSLSSSATREDLAASTSSGGSHPSSSSSSRPPNGLAPPKSGGARPSTAVSAADLAAAKRASLAGDRPTKARSLVVDGRVLEEFERAMEAHSAGGDRMGSSVVMANGRVRRHSTIV